VECIPVRLKEGSESWNGRGGQQINYNAVPDISNSLCSGVVFGACPQRRAAATLCGVTRSAYGYHTRHGIAVLFDGQTSGILSFQLHCAYSLPQVFTSRLIVTDRLVMRYRIPLDPRIFLPAIVLAIRRERIASPYTRHSWLTPGDESRVPKRG
jgi:hypothetical protein